MSAKKFFSGNEIIITKITKITRIHIKSATVAFSSKNEHTKELPKDANEPNEQKESYKEMMIGSYWE